MSIGARCRRRRGHAVWADPALPGTAGGGTGAVPLGTAAAAGTCRRSPARQSALLLSLEAAFHPDAAVGLDETLDIEVDGTQVSVRVHDGTVEVTPGSAGEHAAVRIITDRQDFIDLAQQPHIVVPNESPVSAGQFTRTRPQFGADACAYRIPGLDGS